MAFAVCYGICETMNGNWSQLDMTTRLHASATQASLALAMFWAMVTAGRLLFGAVERWLPERVSYHILPFVLVGTFILISSLSAPHATAGIGVFAPQTMHVDLTADIEVHGSGEQVTARIPLAGQGIPQWLACYQRLGHAASVPVQAEAGPDRTWIVVSVPAGSSPAEIGERLDAALALIVESDIAVLREPPAAQAEASVRDWWARRQAGAARRRPASRIEVVRTGIGTEKRWLLAASLALAMAVLLLLPARFSLGPNWLLPAVEALLLTATFAADRMRGGRRLAIVRSLSTAMVLLLVAGAVFVTVRLVADLVEGGPETNSAADLLGVGFGVWIYTILAFAFLYWLLDGGGPEARIWHPPAFPHLAFPEQLNPVVAPPGWRPAFAGYLYLGFTNATAFSPTDVMPLARWGKLAMALQAVGSLAVLGLVIARAVNIFQ